MWRGPVHSPATDDTVFSDGNNTQSLVDALDPNPTTSLNASCPSNPMDVSYGVDVRNCFACLLVELTPVDCDDSITMSDCPDICHEDSSFCSGSVSTSHDFYLAVSSIPRAECCNTVSCLHAISSLTVAEESLLSSSSLPSSVTSLDVCESVVPPDSLKDLICFTFSNLSSNNLHSMATCFSDSVKDIYLPWVALH